MPLFPSVTSLQQLAATPVAGFALQNGTPTILTWAVPNDGLLHRVLVISTMDVTSTETGGGVVVNVTLPDGTTGQPTLYSSGKSAGMVNANYVACQVKAGSTVTVAQASALTGGASTVWAEIWGA